MKRLPRIGRSPDDWCLPLTETAAQQLAEAWLDDDSAGRTARLTELLAHEPPLALWVACRAAPWTDQPPGGVGDLAAWFAEHGLSQLDWGEGEDAQATVSDLDRIGRWAALAEEACAVASCAARLAGEPDNGPSYLCGLLHNAEAWLASCGSPPRSAGSADLPAWLSDWLQQIGQTPPRTFVPGWVARAKHRITAPADTASGCGKMGLAPSGNGEDSGESAVAKVSVPIFSQPPSGEGTPDPPLDDLQRAARSVRERWHESSAAVGRLLPRLVRRLVRLRQLETEFQTMLEHEKLEALKELAYGASHEINNPLANISTRAQTLMREETDPERRRKLAVINAQAFRAHEMISDMMLFARPPALERKPVELTALADQVIAELREQAESQGTSLLRVTADQPWIVPADANYLAVAIKALCTNSLEAIGRGGNVEIFIQPAAAGTHGNAGGSWMEILVSDDGPGIPPEVRRHLFDPYFSGREAGRGLGLGLSKCWCIIRQHGGRIEVASQPDRGTTFTITLPADACSSTLTAR
jgi:signal transduction histidine kinase